MHVFIDTNILLRFFHFTSEELDALTNVFASHEHGSAEVHLTVQVTDELVRNRASKIKDALRRFEGAQLTPELPAFLKGYPEFGEIRELGSQLTSRRKKLLKKVHADIRKSDLLADRLLSEILKNSELAPITKNVFRRASERVALGNPPGKKGSLGDAVNWELLLDALPDKEDLHIVSGDGDFYSALYDEEPHEFLRIEWRREKQAKLYVYRTLSHFMSDHFDGVAFSFDKNKEALIEELAESGSFATTHRIISSLEQFNYFSAKEARRLMEATLENNQVGGIITDHDLAQFFRRVVLPHKSSLSCERQLRKLAEVASEESEDDGDA